MANTSLNIGQLEKKLSGTRQSFAALIREAVQRSPDSRLLIYQGQSWTVTDVYARACRYVRAFKSLDLQLDQRVAVMLNNHPDHVAVIMALGISGLVWIPLDRRYRAANVRSVLQLVDVQLVLLDDEYLTTEFRSACPGTVLALSDVDAIVSDQSETMQPTIEPMLNPEKVRAILFTSGSTGTPKGVQVTEQMYLASGLFCGLASDADANAVYYVWEPLNHIGGAQLIPMALATGATLALTDRFSVSRYWSEVVACGATRLHYLGGILDLLLSAESNELDRAHNVTLGFGAGASYEVSTRFRHRFGIVLREVYGMTEASSFTSVNFSGVPGSIGQVLPCFDLALVDADGNEQYGAGTGEMALRVVSEQLLTPGYYNNQPATDASFKDGRFFTGDIARRDSTGHLFFIGRNKEIIRCKGENVSPWEIERVMLEHDSISEIAVLGSESQTGDQEIVAFIVIVDNIEVGDIDVCAHELVSTASRSLADFQLPRYIVFSESLPKTPSHRIEKHKLDVSPKALASAWDRLGFSVN